MTNVNSTEPLRARKGKKPDKPYECEHLKSWWNIRSQSKEPFFRKHISSRRYQAGDCSCLKSLHSLGCGVV
jgi:hypothetical protein